MFKGTFEDYLVSPERKAAFDRRTAQAAVEGRSIKPSEERMMDGVNHADRGQYELLIK